MAKISPITSIRTFGRSWKNFRRNKWRFWQWRDLKYKNSNLWLTLISNKPSTKSEGRKTSSERSTPPSDTEPPTKRTKTSTKSNQPYRNKDSTPPSSKKDSETEADPNHSSPSKTATKTK
jgi:hypothetical protein